MTKHVFLIYERNVQRHMQLTKVTINTAPLPNGSKVIGKEFKQWNEVYHTASPELTVKN